MPVYEFHCKECRTEFRTLRRAEALNDVHCPDCGTQRVARLLSVTAAARSAPEPAASCGMRGGACGCNPGGCCAMND